MEGYWVDVHKPKNTANGSQSKRIETAWLDWSCGKNKMILDREEHRKPITEYRKPKPMTLDGEVHRKPITEYRKPSGSTDNIRSSLNC